VPCARIGIRLRSVRVQEVWLCVEPPSLEPLEEIGVISPSCLCALSPPFRRAEG
jgi:hypothetical protein